MVLFNNILGNAVIVYLKGIHDFLLNEGKVKESPFPITTKMLSYDFNFFLKIEFISDWLVM